MQTGERKGFGAVSEGRIETVRSVAHQLENNQNPDPRRAAAVGAFLDGLNPVQTTPASVADRLRRWLGAGFRKLDGYHLAWAEHLRVDALATTDDRLIRSCKPAEKLTIGHPATGSLASSDTDGSGEQV